MKKKTKKIFRNGKKKLKSNYKIFSILRKMCKKDRRVVIFYLFQYLK